MNGRRGANVVWNVAAEDGTVMWDRVPIAVLMDIRDELQALNRVLRCPAFLGIPVRLQAIQRNTTRRKKKKNTAK